MVYINWDKYFLNVCNAVATKSPCLSIQRGAILVRDKNIVATGYNGPARDIPHCGYNRVMKDALLNKELKKYKWNPEQLEDTCPRRIMGYKSGEGLEWCTATHAEQNTIANAARLGVSTLNTTLYINCEIPCKSCLSSLINAGVVEIVVASLEMYDGCAGFIFDKSTVRLRRFEP